VAVPLLLLLTGCATSIDPSRALRRIADDVWARELETNVAARLRLGLPIEAMPDPSYERAAADAAFAREILGRLDGIDPAALSEDERLTRAILRRRLQMEIEGLPFFWHRFPVTPYNSRVFQTNEVFKEFVFRDASDARHYARLLRAFARFVDAMTSVVAEQRGRGILIARPELPLVRSAFGALMREGGASPFAPADARLAALSPAERTAAHEDIAAAIAQAVNPALQRLLTLIGSDYESAAPEAIGIGHYPGGSDAYRYFMRLHTSIDLAPEDVHMLGLREIERIERELEQIRQEVGFRGTREEFHRFLKTDARFFERSSDAIRERLAGHVKKIEPHLDRFFAGRPAAPYGVERLDPKLEGALTFGYYKRPTPSDPAGLYYFNGSGPGERNLLFGLALMAHELVPGHHFQIARQQENESLHPLRRETFDTAFIEGWGEYAAALGMEMGIYDDPYDRAGRLMMDSMLSARLVVDTGMNALGWSRQRAAGFLREHSMLSDTEIATETLRYAADIPAQALAYKVGSLRMIDLRRRAQEQLGPRFDIRQFHEWILGNGSMPLSVLEEYVQEKISRGNR
jgi:uncharacterized protein (DUF885 family)